MYEILRKTKVYLKNQQMQKHTDDANKKLKYAQMKY